MKKILFAMLSLYNGGAERSLVNLLNALPADKYEIDLMLFRKEGIFLGQLPKNVHIVDAPKGLTALYGPVKKAGRYLPVKLIGTAISRCAEKEDYTRHAFRWDHFYRRAAGKTAKKYDVAVGYLHGEVTAFVNDCVCADRKIAWVHTDYKSAGLSPKYDLRHFQNMDAVVSISDKCVDVLKETFPDMASKFVMLENITSSAVVKKRAEEGVPGELGENSIVSIGRLTPLKGFDLAIRAAALLKKRGLPFKWLVIGDGKQKPELEQMIRERGLENEFLLLGAKENPYPYVKGCRVFAQTSRYEGRSVVLDEAKILAKPILVTDYPTVKDQIAGGREGMVVPLTEEGIADGLAKMLTDGAARAKYESYLSEREYGNQGEVVSYMKLFDM